jgi:calcineurin-like phosphoesterase family protein
MHKDFVPKNWYVSDLHFGHKAVIKYCNRPFDSVESMDEHLIDRWNSHVNSPDNVHVLGDFSFYDPEQTSQILQRLNGNKVLIRGNHDNSRDVGCQVGWVRVAHYYENRHDNVKVILSHFPFMSWNKMHHGSYHFHGHSHGSLDYPESLREARIFDVGVDNLAKHFGEYRPVSWQELKHWLALRVPVSIDHHIVKKY